MSIPRTLSRIAGVILVAVPFVPLGAQGSGYVPPAEWALGLFVFGSLALLAVRLAPGIPDALLRGLAKLNSGPLRGRRLALASFAALLALLLVTSAFVFERKPLLVDSVVQVFQAQIFASGRLAAPAPFEEAFVASQHMLVRDGRWYSQYPPGHAALLAIGVLAGLPWAIPILLSLGSAWFMVAFARSAWDVPAARTVTALLPLVPFFWFMGASFMNHVPALFFVSAFLWAYSRWESGGASTWALLAGAAIGLAGLVRPLTALVVATVFLPVGLGAVVRGGRYGSATLAALGGLAAAAAYGAYNAATTGSPMLPGYLELWGSAHGVGFHVSPWGEPHTPLAGVQNEALDLSLLATFFLEWPIPALLPAGVYLAAGRGDRWDRRLAAAFLAIPAAYLFYWHRDAYLGPRFLFAGVAFLVPLTARAFVSLRAGSGRPLPGAAVVLLVLCFGYSAFYATPRRFDGYATSFASMKVDGAELLADHGIDSGVVFVSVSWGNRLLAKMRGQGVPAGDAERAYRRSDHCDLESLLRLARSGGWSPERLTAAIAALPAGGVKLEGSSPNADPTLRLTPGRELTDHCRAELEHDLEGYANWLPFLLHNGPLLDADVLFLRDLRDLNGELMPAAGPAWLYRPGGLEPIETGAPR